MTGAHIDLSELERGAGPSQLPSVEHGTAAAETVQNNGSSSNLGGSSSIGPVHAPVEDDIAPEHDVGQVGLARLKSKDRQFNFYPIFETERSMVLDSSIVEIHNLSTKIRRLRKRIKTKHGVEPHNLDRKQWGRKRWEMMTKKMRGKLKELDTGFVAWRAIGEYARPQPGALEMLQGWIEKQPDRLWQMYNVQNVNLFRLVGPERGPIARFVHESVPALRLADHVLRPFRARSSEDEKFEYRAYVESKLERVATAVALLLIFVFLLMPLAILTFFGANVAVSVSLVLVMAVLVFFLAESMEKSEGRRLILVCAYLAVMGMFLPQSS